MMAPVQSYGHLTAAQKATGRGVNLSAPAKRGRGTARSAVEASAA